MGPSRALQFKSYTKKHQVVIIQGPGNVFVHCIAEFDRPVSQVFVLRDVVLAYSGSFKAGGGVVMSKA